MINMGLISWEKEHFKNLDLWDVAFIKWSTLLIGVIIRAYIAGFVKTYVWIILVLAILIYIRPLVRFFKKV